jgi:hypothetical protein
MSVENNITDNDLMAFCRWYADFHGAIDITPSVMSTCLCGYFSTFTKAADLLLKRCMRLGLVVAAGDKLNIVNYNDNTKGELKNGF